MPNLASNCFPLSNYSYLKINKYFPVQVKMANQDDDMYELVNPTDFVQSQPEDANVAGQDVRNFDIL